MDSRELTPDQLAKLKAALGRHQAYLNALVKRMDAKHFPSSDQLYLDASAADDDPLPNVRGAGGRVTHGINRCRALSFRGEMSWSPAAGSIYASLTNRSLRI